MSQQESSYFDSEQETAYKVRDINHDLNDSHIDQESQGEQEHFIHYVTPEQSMLRGEKLNPTVVSRKSYANWFATTVFVLMILIGGIIWASQVQVGPSGSFGNPGSWPYNSGYGGPYHQMHHQHYTFPSGDQDDDR